MFWTYSILHYHEFEIVKDLIHTPEEFVLINLCLSYFLLAFPCTSNPCQFGGACTNVGFSNYVCNCINPFIGESCQAGRIQFIFSPYNFCKALNILHHAPHDNFHIIIVTIGLFHVYLD